MTSRILFHSIKVVLGILVLQYHAFHLWEHLAPALVAAGLGLALELGSLGLIAHRGKRRLMGWVLDFALAVGAALLPIPSGVTISPRVLSILKKRVSKNTAQRPPLKAQKVWTNP